MMEFVNGKDEIPYIMEKMFETTSQISYFPRTYLPSSDPCSVEDASIETAAVPLLQPLPVPSFKGITVTSGAYGCWPIRRLLVLKKPLVPSGNQRLQRENLI